MASILKQIRSFAHPHYVTNVLLSTVYYFLKTVPPFCSVLFKDCALEMVICLLFTYFRPFWLLSHCTVTVKSPDFSGDLPIFFIK